MAFHFHVLLPSGIASGLNINFMLCPPDAYASFGRCFRIVGSLATAALAFIARYLFISPFCWLLGVAQIHDSHMLHETEAEVLILPGQAATARAKAE